MEGIYTTDMPTDDMWKALLGTMQELHGEMRCLNEQMGQMNARLVRLETLRDARNENRQWAVSILAIIVAAGAAIVTWVRGR